MQLNKIFIINRSDLLAAVEDLQHKELEGIMLIAVESQYVTFLYVAFFKTNKT